LGHPSGRDFRMTDGSRSGHRVRIFGVIAAIAFLGTSARAQESWDAIYLAGTKVGHVHTYVEKLKSQGKDYLRVRIDMEQRIKRGRDFSITRITYGTIEGLDGQVYRLDTLTDLGGQKLRTHGDVVRGEMELILDGNGVKNSVLIPWGPEIRGPYAAEL